MLSIMLSAHTNKSGGRVSGERARAFIASVKPSDVVKAYTGKFGCMCGCNGKYSYNPLHRDASEKQHGCNIAAEGFSSRSVAIILGKLKRSELTVLQDGYILSADDHDRERTLAVYLHDDAALKD